MGQSHTRKPHKNGTMAKRKLHKRDTEHPSELLYVIHHSFIEGDSSEAKFWKVKILQGEAIVSEPLPEGPLELTERDK